MEAEVNVNANEIASQITVRVKLVGAKRWRFRIWLGKQLIWLGCKIIGCRSEIET